MNRYNISQKKNFENTETTILQYVFFGVTITGCVAYQNAINVTIFLKSLSLNFFFTTIDTMHVHRLVEVKLRGIFI